MAMINCPECGNNISDKARTCPSCGCPINDTPAPTAVTVNTDDVLRKARSARDIEDWSGAAKYYEQAIDAGCETMETAVFLSIAKARMGLAGLGEGAWNSGLVQLENSLRRIPALFDYKNSEKEADVYAQIKNAVNKITKLKSNEIALGQIDFYSQVNMLNKHFKEFKNIFEVVDRKLSESDVSVPETSSGGGCYIATCVYGSYDCPQVWTLRRYRDNTLAKTWFGRAFVRVYYAISPKLVKWFGRNSWFKKFWKPTLDKMVGKLNSDGVDNTPYNDRRW